MKLRRTLLAVAMLGTIPLGGCVSMWNDDGNQGTPSIAAGRGASMTKPDRQWRQDIAKEWTEYDRRLSRLRLGEFID